MTKDIIIGIDAGTTIIKAVAFTLEGKEIKASSINNIYLTSKNGHVTQSLDQTWQNCITVISNLNETIENLKDRVAIISVTGQGDGTWLIDKNGNSVCDAWLWLDSRSSELTRYLSSLDSEFLRFDRTGTGLFSGQQSSQLCYMEKNNPEILDKASTAFHCKDWIYFKMTDVKATDPSEACFTFGNFRKKKYDEEVIESLGLKKRNYLFPEIIDGSKISHKLSLSAAKLFGLRPGTPVSLSYIDAVCTFLGSNGLNIDKKIGNSILGTTGGHMKASKIPEIKLNHKLKSGYVMILPIKNLALQFQTNMSGTLNIDWLKLLVSDIFKDFKIDFNDELFINKIDEWLNKAKPGEIIYHPYISEAGERGPFINSNAKASIIGLRSNISFPEILRSFYEGLCFAARECYSAIGSPPDEIILAGGGSKSMVMRTIFSSILKCSVRIINRNEAGATGAAMIGAMSIGLYKDWDSCLETWVDPYLGHKEDYNKKLSKKYDEIYNLYLESRDNLITTWNKINS